MNIENERDPLNELRESEFWEKKVPGVQGWTYGAMIEMAIQEDDSLRFLSQAEWEKMFE